VVRQPAGGGSSIRLLSFRADLVGDAFRSERDLRFPSESFGNMALNQT
jgi:hypothetical protein